MSITIDRTDPRLGHGVDNTPRPQSDAYLVLSEEELAKGFVRPVRSSYIHVGDRPRSPTRPLTPEEQARHAGCNYVAFEPNPDYPEKSPVMGRFWTQQRLDAQACGTVTTMARALAETYARDPHFYGATYCCTCQMHRPVAEFVWQFDGQVVGS